MSSRPLIAALLGAAAAMAIAAPAQAETYADYSRLNQRSAGQFFDTHDQFSGQWSWRTDAPGAFSIAWDRSKPEERELFVRSRDRRWLLMDGWSDNGTYYRQRVTSESHGDVRCRGMKRLKSDGGRQHYVRWAVGGGYCLDARGTITELSSGKVVRFRHRQIWSAPRTCASRYLGRRRCIRQWETWQDDKPNLNGRLTAKLKRDQYLAKDLGMAFVIQQYFPMRWRADMRHHWTY